MVGRGTCFEGGNNMVYPWIVCGVRERDESPLGLRRGFECHELLASR